MTQGLNNNEKYFCFHLAWVHLSRGGQRATGRVEKSKMASFTWEVVHPGDWLTVLLQHLGLPVPPPISGIMIFLRNKRRKKEGRGQERERREEKNRKGRGRRDKAIKDKNATSLAVQWLGTHLPMQGTWAQFLMGELGAQMPRDN